jgi:hypothetical protein
MPSDRGDFVGEATHGLTTIGQKVDDLDDGDLATGGPFELDVDRSRPTGTGINRAFRTCGPAAGPCDADHELLPA